MLHHLEATYETHRDKDSGLEFTQISLADDHLILPYFHREMWSQDDQWLIAERFNTPLTYLCHTQEKRFEILDLCWKGEVKHAHFCRTSDKVWFTRKREVYLGTIGGEAEKVYEIEAKGIIHDFSPNADDSGFTIIVEVAGLLKRIIYVDLEARTETVCREGNVQFGHLQMNPTDKTIIMYADQHDYDNFQRMYTVRTDGREHFPFYRQKKGEWITHESWTRDGKHVTFIRHPEGFVRADDTGEEEFFRKGDYWHCHGNVDGSLIVADQWRGRVDLVRTSDNACVTLTKDWTKEGEWIPQGPLHTHPCISRKEKFIGHVDGRTGQARLRVYTMEDIVFPS